MYSGKATRSCAPQRILELPKLALTLKLLEMPSATSQLSLAIQQVIMLPKQSQIRARPLQLTLGRQREDVSVESAMLSLQTF